MHVFFCNFPPTPKCMRFHLHVFIINFRFVCSQQVYDTPDSATSPPSTTQLNVIPNDTNDPNNGYIVDNVTTDGKTTSTNISIVRSPNSGATTNTSSSMSPKNKSLASSPPLAVATNNNKSTAARNARNRAATQQQLVANNNEYGGGGGGGKRNGTPAGFYANGGGDSLSRLSPEGKDAELSMTEAADKGDGSIPTEVFSTSSNENGKINVQVTVLFGKYRLCSGHFVWQKIAF